MTVAWTPPASIDAFAVDIELGEDAIDTELPKFRRHFIAKGTRRTALGWERSFRTWLANSISFAAERGVLPQSRGPSENDDGDSWRVAESGGGARVL